ncbi:MAG: hypothetical protein DRJ50_09420 [Actinobacteria bacterium]|nr:MAG: hypothetical protein DRJ50_09420 [Actinomycetota bacterium]
MGGALTAAHRAGVIHRDVRPANLLLDEDGTTYLADFGIALPAQHSGAQDVAAPAYAAPELLRNEPGGVTSDVLSLAVTVFELLTGRLPFAETTERAELVRRQLDEPLPSVRATRTDLPASIDDVLARATAKAAGDRHPTVDAFVNDVIAALDVDDSRSVTPAVAGSADEVVSNPYIGIHAFDETDADRFFGRESLVVELVELVEREPLVVVVGPSGSGKSSAVRAGLLPALRRGAVPGSDSWFIASMLPGADPIAALETSLLRIAVNPPSSLREQLAEDGGLLRAMRRVLPDDTSRILLVVDQFEELFTQTDSTDEQQRFLTELAAAIAAPDSPLRVVATLRADHYDAPLRHPGMAELVTAGTVTVRPMVPGEIERAVVLPARHVGVDVEPALVAELVAGVTQRPATLPLLQFALTEIFERRVARVMLHSTYESIGGLTGALAARADRIIGADGSDDEREARRIFSRLVAAGPSAVSAGSNADEPDGDIRRRAHRSEFGDGERTAWLLDAFVSARLLTVDRDPATREPTVEVAHEALLRDWPRLRNWLDEDRDDLATLHGIRTSAAAWEASGFDDGELARSARLGSATELVTRRPDFLNDAEKAWVDASAEREEAERLAELEAIERDRRQNQNLRRLLVAATILLVVSLGAAGGAFVLRNRAVASEQSADRSTAAALESEAQAVEAEGQAQDERATAEAAQETADSERAIAESERENADIERLSAVSAQQITTSPDRAILLALEANRRRDDIGTQTAVHRAIATEPRRLAVFPSRLEQSIATLFSRDGMVGIVWSDQDGLEFFDTGSGELLGVRYEPSARIIHASLSGNGSNAAIALADGTIEVVDQIGHAIQIPEPEGLTAKYLSTDQTGSTVLVQTEETTTATGALRRKRRHSSARPRSGVSTNDLRPSETRWRRRVPSQSGRATARARPLIRVRRCAASVSSTPATAIRITGPSSAKSIAS